MAYLVLADLVVGLHLLFVLFVTLGGGLVLWRRRIAGLHLPAAVWGIWVELSGWVCPLTPLEKHFRTLGGEAGYAGGFLDHYLTPVLYPANLTREQQIRLGILVAVLNLGVYGAVIWKGIRNRKRRETQGR